MVDGEQIQLVGELDDAGKGRLLRGAAALLFPIDWPEPFGLVMIEAMACGTPVIAFGRGSVPEVIDDGVAASLWITKPKQSAPLSAFRNLIGAEFARLSSSASRPSAWPRTT
jgi:glycosyltransferase involved in cell wall biosynthesis